jgi:hypothetical protein
MLQIPLEECIILEKSVIVEECIMKTRGRLVVSSVACAGIILIARVSAAGVLTWETDKVTAMAKAGQESKLVLLLRGDPSCSVCTDARDVLCETTAPGIVGVIQRGFVPWFSDVTLGNAGAEYFDPYDFNYWPHFCCIDPARPNEALDISGVTINPTSFFARLWMHAGSKRSKIRMKVVWGQSNRDTLLVKLPFGAPARPFGGAPTVGCAIGIPLRPDEQVLGPVAGVVRGDRLKAESGTARLKLKWRAKTGEGWLVFKLKKGDVAGPLWMQQLKSSGYVLLEFTVMIDGIEYEYYPALWYERRGGLGSSRQKGRGVWER